MGKAAYPKKVKISSDGGTTWQEIPATASSLDIGGDVLDDTDFKTNAGFRTRVLGLSDWSSSIDANWTSGDAALAIIRAAKLARTVIKFAYLPDGAAGYMGNVVVENFNQSGDVGGLETISISLQAAGALATYA